MLLVRILCVYLCLCGSLLAGIPAAVLESAKSVALVRTCTGVGSASHLGCGLWLTNQHVTCGSCKSAKIQLKDGRVLEGTVVAAERNSELDLALVQTEDPGTPAILLALSQTSGEPAYPTGFDFGKQQNIWPAYFDKNDRYPGTTKRTGPVSGNSGGPILNAQGELLVPLHGTYGNNKTGVGATKAGVQFVQLRKWLQRSCPDGTCPPRANQYRQGTIVPPVQKVVPPVQKLAEIPQAMLSKPPTVKPASPPPAEVTVNYGLLAEKLLPLMAKDGRFVGPAGPVGPRGPAGPVGETGPAGESVDVEALITQIKDGLRVRIVK